jgi:AbrB family looped-hinge helix DNA binding protein
MVQSGFQLKMDLMSLQNQDPESKINRMTNFFKAAQETDTYLNRFLLFNLKFIFCLTLRYYCNTVSTAWILKGVNMDIAINTSKLTTKSQATIPGKIRELLGLSPGDSVAFEVDEKKKVTIRKATAIDFEFAKALEGTLSEWSSKNDEEAYCDL